MNKKLLLLIVLSLIVLVGCEKNIEDMDEKELTEFLEEEEKERNSEPFIEVPVPKEKKEPLEYNITIQVDEIIGVQDYLFEHYKIPHNLLDYDISYLISYDRGYEYGVGYEPYILIYEKLYGMKWDDCVEIINIPKQFKQIDGVFEEVVFTFEEMRERYPNYQLGYDKNYNRWYLEDDSNCKPVTYTVRFYD